MKTVLTSAGRAFPHRVTLKLRHHNEQLVIRLRVDRVGVKSLSLYLEFWYDDRRIAHGRMKTACCICRPNGTLESIEIPDTYRNQFEASMAG